MGLVMLALVLGSTVWVGIDASNLGVKRGRLGGGSLDMSTASWVICCLLLWVLAFPCYLAARAKYKALAGPWHAGNNGGLGFTPPFAQQPAMASGQYSPAYGAAPMPATYAPPAAPPQMSPDGHWWWNGHQWQPAPPRT